MSPSGGDAFNHALHTANVWVADVESAFGTNDRRFAQRAVRAWLHTLRDRLTVTAAVKFGAQLPELLRGIYYDGWEPSRAPERYGAEEYVRRFSTQAAVRSTQVPAVAATVTEVIGQHMSPGQLAEATAELPTDLRDLVTGATTAPTRPGAAAPTRGPAADRVALLEERVGDLTAAVRALARGLEDGRGDRGGIDQTQVTRAARLADEILVAGGIQHGS
ncbi:DUF2267 domain-containing protein [Dactylosporangium sp. NPDC051484]|uniref:DUF2267 domain-containing protein n=1 Tax=Dactylosporangium sp. NPDC051484 TaxID=3154942 RepID=UPI00344FBB54